MKFQKLSRSTLLGTGVSVYIVMLRRAAPPIVLDSNKQIALFSDWSELSERAAARERGGLGLRVQ